MILGSVGQNSSMKLACFCLCLCYTFLGGYGYMRFDSLIDSFGASKKMIVSFDGEDFVFEKGNDKFEIVLSSLLDVLADSHEMPAYCVSLDEETRKAKNEGVWIEFVFNENCKHDGMDFESLLVKVEKENFAMNLIRKHDGKFEGRCFHLSLSGSTTPFFETVCGLSEKFLAEKNQKK